MKPRQRGVARPPWLLPLLLVGSLACSGGVAPPPEQPPQEHTDLALLRKLLKVPAGVVETRFTYAPLGATGGLALGPTDYQVTAWMRVEPSAWPAIDAQWGLPTPRSQPLTLSSETVAWLSPDGPWPSLEQNGDHWTEPEPLHYTGLQLGSGAIRASEAVRVGTDGLYITGMTQ